jgi:prolyl oligopeptidase
MNKKFIPLLALTACTAFNMVAQPIQYPATKKVSQSDDYFSRKIEDPYRWLENDTAKDTEAWVKEQNTVTNNYLSKIPFRNKIHQRLTDLWNYTRYGTPQKEGDWFIFSKNDGLQNQSVMYIQKGLEGKPDVLLDPNKLSTDGTVAIQATAFSRHQKFFAYAVSASGSDWQEIYVIDLNTRKRINERIEFVKFTSMSWRGDEGFYYSGYDRPKDEKTKYSAKTEYQKIFFHQIGTPQSADKLVYEDREHPLRYVGAGLTEDERFLVLSISEGTDGAEIKVKDMQDRKATGFTTIVPGFKTNANLVDNLGSMILLQTNSNAPRGKVVLLNPAHPEEANWKTIVPEQKEPIEAINTGGGKLFVSYLKDACTQVNQYSVDGKLEHKIELPGIGTAAGFGCKKEDDFFFYSFNSFTYPPSNFKYDIKTGKSELYQKPDVKFNPEDFETKQVFYPSKDGTKVPMFITYKKGMKLDGNNPTLLYAYGGFNINITPAFSVPNMVFIENGGVYCVANLRGGGEYGEEWHKAGMLQKKQNVFDDFISAAEYLIKEKYTSSGKLAIRGGSNGGLLIGACLTQRSELFKVAIPQVGVLDMLRYHKFTVGWGWAVEYGSSDNKDQFNYLIKYSPLHNIKKGTCYPATLVTTADHDDRVVPAHSFKFAATLQEAQGCENPTLIRIDSKAGHGAGKPTSKMIDEAADIWSFVFYNMGVNL